MRSAGSAFAGRIETGDSPWLCSPVAGSFPAIRSVSAVALLIGLSGACGPPVAEAPLPSPQPTSAPTRISPPTTAAEKARALSTSAELVASGRCDEAIPLLEILLEVYPGMEDYHLHHLATCSAAVGDEARAVDAWSRLLAQHPQSIHAMDAALGWGRQCKENGDDASAERLLRSVLASEDVSQARAAQLALAELDLERKNVRSAYTVFVSLREQASGDTAELAKGYVVALRERYPELAPATVRERADEARLLIREGDADAALRTINGTIAVAPSDDLPALLQLRARAELASGAAQQHLNTLREIHTRYPRSAFATQAIFDEARWLWNKDSDANAEQVFLEIERRYPRHPRMATVRYALARIAQDAGDHPTALRRFHDVIRTYPRTGLAALSRWQITWIHYYARNLSAAGDELARLGRGRSVASAPEITYWRGRILEARGRRGEARSAYETILERLPDSYYALQAAQRLGEPTRFSTEGVNPRPVAFPEIPGSLAADYHLTRARDLHAAKMMSFARREVRAFSRADPPIGREVMIRLYQSVDGHRQAIRLAGRNRVDVLYPLAFWSSLQQSAARHRIDPFLALSLMRQESLFDPEALSPANARGLMQLLPATAAAVAARIGRAGPIDLFDPATNIELGTAHLRELADRYDGDPVRMLAAYNAGADAVAKWDRRFGDRDRDEFVESITYSETRDYVKKVLSNYRKYQRLYGAPVGRD